MSSPTSAICPSANLLATSPTRYTIKSTLSHTLNIHEPSIQDGVLQRYHRCRSTSQIYASLTGSNQAESSTNSSSSQVAGQSSTALATNPSSNPQSSSTLQASLSGPATKSSASRIPKSSPRPTKPLKKFTCFRKLPDEIKCKIWRYTHKPRVVILNSNLGMSDWYNSATAIPVSLQVCSFSREEAKKFYTLTFGSKVTRRGPRIWFDSSIDMLHIRKVTAWSELHFMLRDIYGLQSLQSISCDSFVNGHHAWFACVKPSHDATVIRGLKELAGSSKSDPSSINHLVTNISNNTLTGAGFKHTSTYMRQKWGRSGRRLEEAIGISETKWALVKIH